MWFGSYRFGVIAVLTSALMLPSVRGADVPSQAFDLQEALKMSCTDAVSAVNIGIQNGYLDAYLLAAKFYEGNSCLKANPARAAELLELAAQKGSGDAARQLAFKFALGEGVPQSYAMAGAWASGKGQSSEALTKNDYSVGYAFALGTYVMRRAAFPKEAIALRVEADIELAINPKRPLDATVQVTSKRSRYVSTGTNISRDYGLDYQRQLLELLPQARKALPMPDDALLVDMTIKRGISYRISEAEDSELVEQQLKSF